ncbi:MAG: hypothetical protein M0Z77_01015 [Thermoplasmatales archaeon]|nr:hypothetical protein [Thermoplasmatales archaeon]
MQKKVLNKKLVLTFLIVTVMLGSMFLTSAYAAVPPYSASYTETGLPTGSTFTVSLANATKIATSTPTAAGSAATISGLYNGTYVLSAAATPGTGHKYSGLIWNLPSSTIVGISGAYAGTVTFSEEFLLNFTESGLASGTAWNVLVGSTKYSSSKSYLDINELNGTYSYSVLGISGYSVTPLSGSIVLNGGNVSVPLAYSATGETFTVTFSESNLPPGSLWGIILNGETTSINSASTSYSLTNGTYEFKISDVGSWYAIPSSGTITVNGKAVTQNITFRYGYLVTFNAANLAKGVQWSVTYNGTTNTSTASTITFFIANGSYKFSVSIAANWIGTPSSGYLNISGNAVSLSIGFTEIFYRLTFQETGLPSNTLWTITVNGQIYQTTNGTVILSEHNGTFNFVAATLSGYKSSPSSGVITLAYSSVVETISYSASTVKSGTGNGSGGFTIPTSFTAFLHAYEYYLLAGLIVAALIAILVREGVETRTSRKSKKHYK